MDYKKLALYALLSMVGVALWNDWLKEHKPEPVVAQTQNSNQNYVPTAYQPNAQTETTQPTALVENTSLDESAHDLIHVKTDVLDVDIDSVGGNISRASLLKFPVSLKEKNVPVDILSNDAHNLYITQSGLTSANKSAELKFHAAQKNYVLEPKADSLVISLNGQTADGIAINKIYTFKRGNYAIHIDDQVSNRSSKAWSGSIYSQIKQKPVEQEHGFMQPRTYEGATLSSPEKRYQKVAYKKLESSPLNLNIKDGWMAMQQHYFLSAWIPDPKEMIHYYSNVTSMGPGEFDKIYTLGFITPEMSLAPGKTSNFSSTLYVGPETAKQLEQVAPGLDLTIDYGWLWIISKAIFWVMDYINSAIGNWGWSIIIVTVLIKALFYKLSEASYRSMARMRGLQPRLATLKERYGDDRQKLSQATMEMYKKEKINPLGGCLPVVVQIPVFIALYYVLFESVELRQAPFIFWIHDLSTKDPYYVLPVLMGFSMFLQQRLSPPPPDPVQAKVMMFLPVIFTVFFLSFPSGLVLYWLVNNCLSALQQWTIIRRMETHSTKNKK